MTPQPEILLAEHGALGRITLNRPTSLNSLTLGMVQAMRDALERWRDADHIHAVLIEGAGDRGLCAGGDVVALHNAASAGDDSFALTFWTEEYRLNAALARYPKPVIGLMDGITMGGGIGITAHDSHRVVTERSKIAMPEVGIGFVPDVGGTYLLSNAPGELGTHLALTATRIGGADALYCGLADYYVRSDRLADLAERLTSQPADDVLREFSECQPDPQLEAEQEWIDAAYSADSVEEILRRLRARPEDAAQAAADAMETKSPVALKVTLRSLRSRFESLEQALDQEFRVSVACLRIGDFVEGVRAALVDKDRAPTWSPPSLSEVDSALVEKFFHPLPDLGLSG